MRNMEHNVVVLISFALLLTIAGWNPNARRHGPSSVDAIEPVDAVSNRSNTFFPRSTSSPSNEVCGSGHSGRDSSGFTYSLLANCSKASCSRSEAPSSALLPPPLLADLGGMFKQRSAQLLPQGIIRKRKQPQQWHWHIRYVPILSGSK